jgi:hypothetical protein
MYRESPSVVCTARTGYGYSAGKAGVDKVEQQTFQYIKLGCSVRWIVVNCSVYLAEQLYRVRQKIGRHGVGQEAVRLPLDEL